MARRGTHGAKGAAKAEKAAKATTTPKVAADDAPANHVAGPATTDAACADTAKECGSAKELVWAKFAPDLPWWPARLISDAVGPTVAVQVLGACRGAPDVLRLLRSRVDRDFERSLPERANPWKRRKCAGMRRAFSGAMLHAKQIMAPASYARCCRCEQFVVVDLPRVPWRWTCSGCREKGLDASGAGAGQQQAAAS